MRRRLGHSLASAAMYLGQRISAVDAKSAGFVLELLSQGDEFESEVLSWVEAGLALAGPPELRSKTLKAYKALVDRDADREALRKQCREEFELIREKDRSGETQRAQAYYRRKLPH